MKITASIYRFNSAIKNKPKFKRYKVPYKKGMTVLDIILYVYKNIDSTLAFRYECRQGICGTCGIMLNGKPVLSCSTQIDSHVKVNKIEPLYNFPVEKDLIVNLKPILVQYMKIKPFIDKFHKVVVTKNVSNKSKAFRKCIECGCCIAGVPSVTLKGKSCLDPMSLIKIARFYADPRDGLNRRKIAKKFGIKNFPTEFAETLLKICPRGIPFETAIQILQ